VVVGGYLLGDLSPAGSKRSEHDFEAGKIAPEFLRERAYGERLSDRGSVKPNRLIEARKAKAEAFEEPPAKLTQGQRR
jgi:hypothetical protein